MADSSSALRLEQIPGKGRGWIAARPIKAGQIVLRESPIILYSAIPLISHSEPSCSSFSYCDYCFRIFAPALPESILSCPLCPHARFCSENCLSTAQKSSHSSWVCQALSLLRESSSLLEQPPERQVQARFVVAAYNLAILSPSDLQSLLSLLGTPDSTVVFAAQFLHSLISSLCPPQTQLSVELTAQLLAKDRLNSFCLMEPYSPDGPQRSIKAYAIYPEASLFNHACLPNACRFGYLEGTAPGDARNTDIIIRTIQDIPEGTEVCISYFRINRDYDTRKKILMQDYGFSCKCERCKIEAHWSATASNGDFPHAYFLSKYVCDRINCSGTLAPLPPTDHTPSNVVECNFCGNLKTDVASEQALAAKN
ncbi:hypothetical protein L6164_020380 [Bauhinia variegata]|uniref:Uncharacterized protein n=1 Tax=Bauhinia variegata TaxID=167791 RepID=A0ACB9MWX8_BAUVA|nr:hypothetical protein L6164_020380 [Bauhinia variegata]